MTTLVLLLILAAAVLGHFFWSKERVRRKLLSTLLSDRQRSIIADHVPLVRRLPSGLSGRLEGKINVFLSQVEFIGCNGLEVTDEMRLSIAAQACLLVVNSEVWYNHLRTILIYPSAFKSRRTERDGYVVTERESVRTGESWSRGPVVLSWRHAEAGAANDRDGHNVVLHEFAHQIDDLSREAGGATLLGQGQTFAEWARVFSQAFDRHVQHVGQGHRTLFDPYGASAPQEFFAVAVEVFFERPADMKREDPEVYRQLSELFRLDPASWD